MLSVLTGNVGINGGNSGVAKVAGIWGSNGSQCSKTRSNADFRLYMDRCHRPWYGNDRTRDGVRGKEKLDVPIKFLWCTPVTH